MDEQIFYEPEPIQVQEQIVKVYRNGTKLYIDGYTMLAANKYTSVFKDRDNFYEVYSVDLPEICANIAGSNGSATVEYIDMAPEEIKKIVEYNDNSLDSMFYDNASNEKTGRVR